MDVVDVSFGIQGNLLPVDHGYHLFSAISHVLPNLHSNEEIGIHPIRGQLAGNRKQFVTQQSRLTIRLPILDIPTVLPLAGKSLDIDRHKVLVGVPHTRALIPHPTLYSRLVVIKGFVEPEPFLEAAKRQMAALGVTGTLELIPQREVEEANRDRKHGSHSPVLRRTVRIRDKEVVGFAVRAKNLSPEHSVLLQAKGIGGRRRFGCGLFVPMKA